jgi:hypothetical protein
MSRMAALLVVIYIGTVDGRRGRVRETGEGIHGTYTRGHSMVIPFDTIQVIKPTERAVKEATANYRDKSPY